MLTYTKAHIKHTIYTKKSRWVYTHAHRHIYTCWAVLCLVTQSCPTVCSPTDCSPSGSSVHGDSPGKNTGVGYHALHQVIFPTQRSNPGLLHCRRTPYQLSHQGSPRILEWVAYPFSRGPPWPRNRTRGSPALQAEFLPAELPEKPIYTLMFNLTANQVLPIKFLNMREVLLTSKKPPLNQTLLSITAND